jgi:hypothetical protein
MASKTNRKQQQCKQHQWGCGQSRHACTSNQQTNQMLCLTHFLVRSMVYGKNMSLELRARTTGTMRRCCCCCCRAREYRRFGLMLRSTNGGEHNRGSVELHWKVIERSTSTTTTRMDNVNGYSLFLSSRIILRHSQYQFQIVAAHGTILRFPTMVSSFDYLLAKISNPPIQLYRLPSAEFAEGVFQCPLTTRLVPPKFVKSLLQ